MICNNCGQNNDINSNVCIKCGMPLSNQMNYQQNTNNTINNVQNNKNNKILEIIKKYWIILLVLVIVVVAVFAFSKLKKKISNNSSNEENDVYNEKFSITKSESFFIKDENSDGYALFNFDGKKLTDYIYKTNKVDPYNHSLLVETLDGKKCVINDSGKEIIKCGSYKELTRHKIIYEAKNDDKTYILDTKGKKIKEFSDYVDIDTYIDPDEIVLVNNNNKYYVIDYEGDIIFDFDEIDDDDINSPSVNYKDGIVTVFYNGKTYVADIKKNKLLDTISDTNHLCVNSTDGKGNTIVLQSCASWFESVDNKRNIILYKGKKTYDKTENESCETINADNDILKCYKNYTLKLIDKNGNELLDVDTYNMSYANGKDYAKTENKTVTFYKDGKKVNQIEGSLDDYGYNDTGKYIIKVKDGYMLYGSDGKPIVDKVFTYLKTNDYATYGSIDKEKEKNVFITSDKKLSNEYYDINNSVEKYYSVNIDENTYNVVDSETGKTKLPNSTTEYTISKKGDFFVAYSYDNETTKMYNIETGKLIIDIKSKISLYDYYFTVEKDGKIEYYSYKTGKMFLSKSK